MLLLSVIIPIYNTASYLERCVISLMEQTLAEGIEYIFVDDCSTDNSIELLQSILQHYPQRAHQIQVYTTSSHSGIGTARALGMSHARGEYIIHCDSDDWVSLDAYQSLVDKIQTSKPDLILADFFLEEEENTIRVTCPESAISQRLSTGLWWMLWNHAVKRSLLEKHDLSIDTGISYWEDMEFLMRVYHFANDIAYLHHPIYHYNRCNPSALTRQCHDLSMLEPCLTVINHLTEFYQLQKADPPLRLLELKRSTRDLFLRLDSIDWKSWLNLYPESWHYVWYDSRLNLGYRLVYSIASKGFTLPFRLYLLCSIFRRQ